MNQWRTTQLSHAAPLITNTNQWRTPAKHSAQDVLCKRNACSCFVLIFKPEFQFTKKILKKILILIYIKGKNLGNCILIVVAMAFNKSYNKYSCQFLKNWDDIVSFIFLTASLMSGARMHHIKLVQGIEFNCVTLNRFYSLRCNAELDIKHRRPSSSEG